MSEYLDLVVNVRYYGTKARDFYEGSRKAMDILREDLMALKLPHPKTEKTLIRSLPDGRGECSFMWPDVPAQSVLHRHLSTRIYGQETKEARRSLLKELSICRLSLRESPGGTVSLDSRNSTWRTWGGARAEAQSLLDNMALALKVPKNEPIEPTLPDSPRAQDRSFVAPSIPLPSPVAPPISDMPNPYANRQFDCPMLSSKRTTLTRPIKILPESPVIPSPSLYNESSDPIPPGLTFSARSSNQIPNNTMRPPATSRKRSRSFTPLDFRPRRPPPDPSHRHLSNTNGDSSSSIESLVFELQFVRGQIAGNLGHEASILSQLDALGHTVSLRETPQEIALREKLQALELQLQAETRMRIEAENALKDFQTECREPFLVPVLYDMVESISRLTTEVVGRIQQEARETVE